MLTNKEIENFYYNRLNKLTQNISLTNTYLNDLRNNIDCTVYIEAEKEQRVYIYLFDLK